MDISIHAPAWGATVTKGRELQSLLFQSTRPRGARPDRLRQRLIILLFQSTRPRGARRRAGARSYGHRRISIHAPAWGATIVMIVTVYEHPFQSTRPRGARRRSFKNTDAAFKFQSTRPRGARRRMECPSSWAQTFQSTRPRGARRGLIAGDKLRSDFNPRARVGRDPTSS